MSRTALPYAATMQHRKRTLVNDQDEPPLSLIHTHLLHPERQDLPDLDRVFYRLMTMLCRTPDCASHRTRYEPDATLLMLI